MSKIIVAARILKWALLILLVMAVAGFLSFINIYGVFLASVTAFILGGVYKNRRWAYFTAAAWGLACYQLAKQGYEFQAIKHPVMILGVVVIPIALFLHEILGRQHQQNARTSVIDEVNNDEFSQKNVS